MTNCIVCNQGHDLNGKPLDDSKTDPPLWLRLQNVLGEHILGDGWLCFYCQSDLEQIEHLQNDFKQRYLDTTRWNEQLICKVGEARSLLEQTRLQILYSDNTLSLPKSSNWSIGIKSEKEIPSNPLLEDPQKKRCERYNKTLQSEIFTTEHQGLNNGGVGVHTEIKPMCHWNVDELQMEEPELYLHIDSDASTRSMNEVKLEDPAICIFGDNEPSTTFRGVLQMEEPEYYIANDKPVTSKSAVQSEEPKPIVNDQQATSKNAVQSEEPECYTVNDKPATSKSAVQSEEAEFYTVNDKPATSRSAVQSEEPECYTINDKPATSRSTMQREEPKCYVPTDSDCPATSRTVQQMEEPELHTIFGHKPPTTSIRVIQMEEPEHNVSNDNEPFSTPGGVSQMSDSKLYVFITNDQANTSGNALLIEEPDLDAYSDNELSTSISDVIEMEASNHDNDSNYDNKPATTGRVVIGMEEPGDNEPSITSRDVLVLQMEELDRCLPDDKELPTTCWDQLQIAKLDSCTPGDSDSGPTSRNVLKAKRSKVKQKPFECLICNKVFIQLRGLQTHSRVHAIKKAPLDISKCLEDDLKRHALQVTTTVQLFHLEDEAIFAKVASNKSRSITLKNSETEQSHKIRPNKISTKKSSGPGTIQQIGSDSCKSEAYGQTFLKGNDAQRILRSTKRRSGSFENSCGNSLCDMNVCIEKQQLNVETAKQMSQIKRAKDNDPTYEPGSESGSSHHKLSKSQEDFPCNYCDGKFVLKTHLKKHIRKEHPKQFPCTYCDQIFPKRFNLATHLTEEHSGKLPHECSICHKGFDIKHKLKLHMRAHSTARPFVCDQCGKSFKSRDQLQQHIRFHTGRALQCPVCSKQILTKSAMKTHMKSHSVKIITPRIAKVHGPRHQCWKCGKLLAESSMKDHMLCHMGERNFPCHLCSKAYFTKISLDSHMITHNPSRPFKCWMCGLSFKRKHEVMAHEKTHSTERPFQCTKCGKGFRMKPNFVRHMSTHTNIRPFRCLICFHSFKRAYQLKEHGYTHTPEAMFSCTLCDTKFRHRSSIKKHMLRHAQTDDQAPAKPSGSIPSDKW